MQRRLTMEMRSIMSEPCGRDERCERQQQEYEFIMEGITTRMQTAMGKMSDTVKYVCIVLLAVIIIMASAFITFTKLWIDHDSARRTAWISEVVKSEALPELRPGADDR